MQIYTRLFTEKLSAPSPRYYRIYWSYSNGNTVTIVTISAVFLQISFPLPREYRGYCGISEIPISVQITSPMMSIETSWRRLGEFTLLRFSDVAHLRPSDECMTSCTMSVRRRIFWRVRAVDKLRTHENWDIYPSLWCTVRSLTDPHVYVRLGLFLPWYRWKVLYCATFVSTDSK